MKRVTKIYRHPLYRKHFEALQQAEKEREFCRHDLTHFLDVARIAAILNLKDGEVLSDELIYSAALLHDIGRYLELTEGTPHHEGGAYLARRILADCGFSPQETELITGAIASHRGHEDEEARCLGTAENSRFASYIYRADKLSRNCFACNASDKCKWSEERKNHEIKI